MIQIAEEEAALVAKQKSLVEMKLEVENFIKRIPNEKQQRMLRLKYLKDFLFRIFAGLWISVRQILTSFIKKR